jgi:hypothetical protein
MKDDLKKKQRESKNHLRVIHKNSKKEFPKPNKTPQPPITKCKCVTPKILFWDLYIHSPKMLRIKSITINNILS